MQKTLILTLVLTAAVLAASSVETGPTERVIPPWQHLWSGLEPADQVQPSGTGIVTKGTEPDWALQGTDGRRTQSERDDPNWMPPAQDWGNDILVGEVGYESDGRISVDNDDVTVGDPGLAGHTPIVMDRSSTGNGSVSGGAGSLVQPTEGDSGTADFSLTRFSDYRTVTIAIRPDGGS